MMECQSGLPPTHFSGRNRPDPLPLPEGTLRQHKIRRAGVGKLLMQHLFDIAVKNDCSRVEWTTDADNREAQLFYEELGVPVSESKLFYRIEGDELTQRAKP
jgi:ribosomal protein S18 acetylase RimI-like enzyme